MIWSFIYSYKTFMDFPEYYLFDTHIYSNLIFFLSQNAIWSRITLFHLQLENIGQRSAEMVLGDIIRLHTRIIVQLLFVCY